METLFTSLRQTTSYNPSNEFRKCVYDRTNHPEDGYEFYVGNVRCEMRPLMKFNWSGYVYMPLNHPDRNVDLNRLQLFYPVHNGISHFENGRMQFDTIGPYDYCPVNELNLDMLPTYKSFDFVKNETIKLASNVIVRYDYGKFFFDSLHQLMSTSIIQSRIPMSGPMPGPSFRTGSVPMYMEPVHSQTQSEFMPMRQSTGSSSTFNERCMCPLETPEQRQTSQPELSAIPLTMSGPRPRMPIRQSTETRTEDNLISLLTQLFSGDQIQSFRDSRTQSNQTRSRSNTTQENEKSDLLARLQSDSISQTNNQSRLETSFLDLPLREQYNSVNNPLGTCVCGKCKPRDPTRRSSVRSSNGIRRPSVRTQNTNSNQTAQKPSTLNATEPNVNDTISNFTDFLKKMGFDDIKVEELTVTPTKKPDENVVRETLDYINEIWNELKNTESTDSENSESDCSSDFSSEDNDLYSDNKEASEREETKERTETSSSEEVPLLEDGYTEHDTLVNQDDDAPTIENYIDDEKKNV